MKGSSRERLDAARGRVQSGALFAPAGDSALDYLTALQTDAPDLAGLAEAWEAFREAGVLAIQGTIGRGEWAAADAQLAGLARAPGGAAAAAPLAADLAAARLQETYLATAAQASVLTLERASPAIYPPDALARRHRGLGRPRVRRRSQRATARSRRRAGFAAGGFSMRRRSRPSRSTATCRSSATAASTSAACASSSSRPSAARLARQRLFPRAPAGAHAVRGLMQHGLDGADSGRGSPRGSAIAAGGLRGRGRVEGPRRRRPRPWITFSTPAERDERQPVVRVQRNHELVLLRVVAHRGRARDARRDDLGRLGRGGSSTRCRSARC